MEMAEVKEKPRDLRWTDERVAMVNRIRSFGMRDEDLALLLGVSRQRLGQVAGRRPRNYWRSGR